MRILEPIRRLGSRPLVDWCRDRRGNRLRCLPELISTDPHAAIVSSHVAGAQCSSFHPHCGVLASLCISTAL
jgi:hypothetical protein